MTEQDLAEIERKLGTELPAEYRAVMLDYPFYGPYSIGQDALRPEVEQVLELNEHLSFDSYLSRAQQPGATWWDRLMDRLASSKTKQKWIQRGVAYKKEWQDRFQIGTDGGEETYFMRLQAEDTAVFTFDLETGEIRQTAENLRAWIRYLQDVENELRKEQGERPFTDSSDLS